MYFLEEKQSERIPSVQFKKKLFEWVTINSNETAANMLNFCVLRYVTNVF